MYTDFNRFNEICRIFINEGYITGLSRVLKQGKEATILCCDADPSTGATLLALKTYKDSSFRNFKNDAPYLSGKVWDRRMLKRLKTVKHGVWVDTEYAILRTLYDAGIRVPKPYLQAGNAILMEYVTCDGEAAPLLKDQRFDPERARILYEEVLHMVERMLQNNVIHGDLSAYNILYDGSNAVLIDFPQAVFVSSHADPFALLCRDLDNVCAYFAKFGITDAGTELAIDLWSRHQHRVYDGTPIHYGRNRRGF